MFEEEISVESFLDRMEGVDSYESVQDMVLIYIPKKGEKLKVEFYNRGMYGVKQDSVLFEIDHYELEDIHWELSKCKFIHLKIGEISRKDESILIFRSNKLPELF
jgi:hypothetical protein